MPLATESAPLPPPIHIHVDIAVPSLVESFTIPLSQPITINRHTCYNAKLHQIFIHADETVKERKLPCYLVIKDAWKSNLEERHIVQRQTVRRSDFRTIDAACLLPSGEAIVHSNINLLPPTSGIYNHLEFSVIALNKKQISFKRLIAFIEIQQCRATT